MIHCKRLNIIATGIVAILVTSFLAGDLMGQAILTNPLNSRKLKSNLSSGKIYHKGEESQLVWSEEISLENANWVRLQFKHLALAGDPQGGESSILKITSLEDGAFQTLNSKTAQQWRNTSAYFNGNAVRLELFAAANQRMNLIAVSEITAGIDEYVPFLETICDDIDDRQLSNDPRAGRTAPGGCTGWLFNDRSNCMLTAGHCAPSTEVMLFNVPLSDSQGNRQFPGPEDQYAVDFSSFQDVNGGVGNDWCYFGCFPNANTGLTAFQAQGQSYQLADPGPVQNGDQIRITGYGSTSFPVNPMWNGAQKTHLGDYALFTNEELGYRTDTTGGNSGSPIIFEATGEAIGIHTHGGCGNNGNGGNLGTGITQFGLANALNNPQGICELNVGFNFPNGLPDQLSPTGGTVILLEIDQTHVQVNTATATMNVDSGNGFEAIPVVDLGEGMCSGTFGKSDCGSIVQYYFSVNDDSGETFSNPYSAPNSTYAAISAEELSILVADDFETDLGWTVSGDATTGQWERGIPAGGGDRNDPAVDADGSGNCYVTQN
ncbi:MAG: trypsin-like peptidase domain-containing protein, partial [Planctomycetota bacterium]